MLCLIVGNDLSGHPRATKAPLLLLLLLLLLLCCTLDTVNWSFKRRRFEFESLKDFLYFRNRWFRKHPQIHFLRVFGWRLLMALRSVALVCDANVV